LDASEGLKKVGCVPITPIHVADELKNQDEAFCTWEEALFGGDSAALYSKSNTPQDEVEGENIASSNDSGGEKRTFVYTGSAALTKDEETIGRELDRLVEQRYKESWYSHAGTLLKSTDLFSFKATEGDDYLQSGAIQPGDHIGKLLLSCSVLLLQSWLSHQSSFHNTQPSFQRIKLIVLRVYLGCVLLMTLPRLMSIVKSSWPMWT